jgi:hypothetical protein
VISEYKRDFSGIVNEMNHRPAMAFSAGVSKFFDDHWEAGFEYEYSTFRGYSNHPDFSADRYGHYVISEMRIEPVVYDSWVKNGNLILTWHIRTKNDKGLAPFVYFKGGFTRLFSELKYKAGNEIIFTKTHWEKDNLKASIFVNTFNIGTGAGIGWVINPNLGLNFMFDINNVFDDNLDAVHNFSGPPPQGYRNFVNGLYGRLMIGVSWNLNPDRKTISAEQYRSKVPGARKKDLNNYFPFYRNNQ